MALEKGTEEWMFWSEFFQFCKKYWETSGSEEYWEEMAKEANELYDKYKTVFAQYMIFAFLDAQNEKYQEKIGNR